MPEDRLVLPYAERELTWATKNLARALNQLRGSVRALRDGRVRRLTNERRGEVTFDYSTVAAVHGLVLVDQVIGAYDPAALAPAIKTSAFPVHVFALSEWPLLCSELSTTSDFISYLRFRARVLKEQPLLVGWEADLLAYFIMNERHPDTPIPSMHQLEGLGSWFGERFGAELAARNAADRCSYLIDDVINHLHDIDESFAPGSDLPISTDPREYLYVAVELAQLNRMERRALGGKLLERIRLAAETGCHRYSVIRGRGDCGFLVLASPDARVTRCRSLAAMTALAKHTLRVRRMVGIATEAGVGLGRSYDTVYLDYAWAEDSKADELAAGSFSEPYESSEYEFLPSPAR